MNGLFACPHCLRPQPHGHYDMRCVGCCARLVSSTKPDKRAAESMLAVIDMYKGAPSRKQIVSAMRDAMRAAA